MDGRAGGRAARMNGLGGVLLTGGTSARLGVDKATLVLDGETLAARACRQLRAVCETVVEVGPGWTSAPATRETPLGAGPLVALIAGVDALLRTGHDASVVLLACDLPGVEPVLARLADASPDRVTMPIDEHGRRQYVCARYSPDAILRARELVGAGERSLHRLLVELGPAKVDDVDGFAPGTFADIDVPDDARRAGIDLPR